MNPYEAPKTGEAPIPVQRRKKLIVAVTLAVAAGIFVGGVVTFFLVRAENARVLRASMIRTQKAVEAKVRKAEETAAEADRRKESPAP